MKATNVKAAKGFQKQTTDAPDFLVAYSVEFEDKLKVFSGGYNDWPAYYGSWWPSYYGFGLGYWPGHYNFAFSPRYFYWPGFYGAQEPVLREYKGVTLTSDILNPETAELIWRGWYVDEVENVNLQEEKINEAVERFLEKFPLLQNNVDNVAERIT